MSKIKGTHINSVIRGNDGERQLQQEGRERVIGAEEGRTDRASDFAPFVGRTDKVVYETDEGEVRTVKARRGRYRHLLEEHFRGAQRLGLFPTVKGHCRFGVADLDAHSPTVSDRCPDAVALVDFLHRRGVVAYLATSRGGRGAHVWMFFDAPGVCAFDLHAFLQALACELRPRGRVDVFPRTPWGSGGAVFLPYFGGKVDLLDVDLKPVTRDRLESNPVAVTPHVEVWPPRYWSFGQEQSGAAAEFQQRVAALRAEGLVFEGAGLLQARLGTRNTMAIGIAMRILRRGGSWSDFAAWDAGNEPPLATDEPRSLRRIWDWAERRFRRQRMTGPDPRTASAREVR